MASGFQPKCQESHGLTSFSISCVWHIMPICKISRVVSKCFSVSYRDLLLKVNTQHVAQYVAKTFAQIEVLTQKPRLR